jgi:putative sterol carrier protein
VSGDATTAFFEALAGRGPEPALEKTTGTIRFDLTGGGRTARWLVSIKKGDVGVSRRNAAADCVLRVDGGLFERIATGRANAMAAVLRGAVDLEGDRALLVAFQRLFPSPPRAS